MPSIESIKASQIDGLSEALASFPAVTFGLGEALAAQVREIVREELIAHGLITP